MVIGKRLNALVSAALIAVFGFIGVHEGLSFNIGSVSRMGPGFFPMALGVILVVVSAVILVQGFLQGSKLNETLQLNLEVKGWLLVLAGICSFILLGEVVGFVPAIFALVFLSALGDSRNSLKVSLIAAAVTTTVGFVIFGVLLRIPMNAFAWGN